MGLVFLCLNLPPSHPPAFQSCQVLHAKRVYGNNLGWENRAGSHLSGHLAVPRLCLLLSLGLGIAHGDRWGCDQAVLLAALQKAGEGERSRGPGPVGLSDLPLLVLVHILSAAALAQS